MEKCTNLLGGQKHCADCCKDDPQIFLTLETRADKNLKRGLNDANVSDFIEVFNGVCYSLGEFSAEIKGYQ